MLILTDDEISIPETGGLQWSKAVCVCALSTRKVTVQVSDPSTVYGWDKWQKDLKSKTNWNVKQYNEIVIVVKGNNDGGGPLGIPYRYNKDMPYQPFSEVIFFIP